MKKLLSQIGSMTWLPSRVLQCMKMFTKKCSSNTKRIMWLPPFTLSKVRFSPFSPYFGYRIIHFMRDHFFFHTVISFKAHPDGARLLASLSSRSYDNATTHPTYVVLRSAICMWCVVYVVVPLPPPDHNSGDSTVAPCSALRIRFCLGFSAFHVQCTVKD